MAEIKIGSVFECPALSPHHPRRKVGRQDGLPIGNSEAMASGVPVITSPIGRNHREITNNVNGICAESGNTLREGSALRLDLMRDVDVTKEL